MLKKHLNFWCLFCHTIVSFSLLFVFLGTSIGVQQKDIPETMLVNALKSYYGEWEIVEDFGYHGIHKTTEIEKFEVGNIISFQRDAFCCEDSIDIPYPRVVIEMTTNANMQQVDRMAYPHQMGFGDQHAQYAKITIYANTDFAYNFYILNDNEILLEGDVHHYYRAVRKD